MMDDTWQGKCIRTSSLKYFHQGYSHGLTRDTKGRFSFSFRLPSGRMAGRGNSAPVAMVGCVIPLVRHSLGEGGNSPNREGRNEMRRDKLFGNKFMRFAACALMAFVCAGESWGKGINPAYKKWIQQNRVIEMSSQETVENGSGNVAHKAMRLRSSSPKATVSTGGTFEGVPLNESTGYVPPLINYGHLSFLNTSSSRLNAGESLPKQYDARTNDLLTDVRDQGIFGTCWAHAAIGAVETVIRKEHPDEFPGDTSLPDFSENNMVMQNWRDYHPHGRPNKYTGLISEYDQGGSFQKAFAYLGRWGGLINETIDPYPSVANQYESYRSNVQSPAIWHVQSYEQYAPKSSPLDHDAIKRAIMKYGGVWVSYRVSDGVQFEDDDGEVITIPFYSEDKKSYYSAFSVKFSDSSGNVCSVSTGEQNSNHAVLLVGWDDNYSKSNFLFKSDPERYTTVGPKGKGAYLIKNSWGEDFGDGGYLWISYYDDNMLYDYSYAIPSVSPSDNYSEIYQYDPLGLVYQFPYSEYEWGANVFTATNDAQLAAVGFYSMSPSTSYTIKIHTGVLASNPVSGICANGEGQTGSVSCAGYSTIVLDSPVTIKDGERFSVVLRLESPGVDEPFGSEVNLPYRQDWTKKVPGLKKFSYSLTSMATAQAGQSFVSTDGTSGTWRDIVTDVPSKCIEEEGYVITVTDKNGVKTDIYDEVIYDTSTANLCIKGYMLSASPLSTLKSIEIAGSGTSIAGGEPLALTCAANYDNAQPKDVTSLANWTIEKGASYAELVSPGRIITTETTDNQLINVKATYAEGGIEKEDTWDFYVVAAAPETPVGVTAAQGSADTHVRVEWAETHGATSYSVFRSSTSLWKNAIYICKLDGETHYNDTNAVPGVDYWYFIKAGNIGKDNKYQYSEPSAGARGWRKLSPPEVAASDDCFDKVAISWSEVEGATHYRVYRAESIDGEKVPISGWIDGTKFDDNRAAVGVTYLYYVAAAIDAAGSRPSDYSIFDDGIRPEPVTIDCLMIKGDESIVSGGLANYSADAVYTDGHLAENITPDKWRIKAGGEWASVSNGRVTANTVTENKSIVLMATYADGGKTATGEKPITITAVKPSVPSGLKVVSASSAGIVLEWTAVAGAASYRIYRNDVALGTADGAATYTDKSAVPGVEYSYSVSASNGAGESGRSTEVSATVLLAAPTGVSATNDRTDGVLVEWKPSPGASYYRVARSTSAAGTKTQLGSWQAGSPFLDDTAVAGTTYFYFIRAATTPAGGNSSDYSGYAQGKRVPAKTLAAIEISGADKVSSSKSTGYYCKAIYTDNTTKTVAPSWSVSPSSAATISSTGLLTAKAVSANTAATVSASFTDGTTKTATKQVTIVAPLKATAEIRNMSVASRWPFSPMIDIDYELVTQPESAKAMVSVFGRDEDHGADMTAATLSGDGADGSYIAAGKHRLSWDIGADYPGLHVKSFSVSMTATPSIVGVPENVTAAASTSGVTLNWNAVEDAAGYEVWRGTGTTTNGATRISTVTGGTTYADAAGTAGVTYSYWLRAYTDDGFGEFAAPIVATRIVIIPTDLTINGDSSVTAGGTANYTCIVARNDGTSGAVTPVWTVSSGSEYASISSAGFLTARGIASAQSVTIKASYSQNGTSVTANKTVSINPNLVAISFDANGGMVSPASKQYVAYGTYGTLPDATRSGCVFEGWYTSVDGGVKIEAASVVPSVMTTLHARWSLQAPADVTASSMASKSITISWAANDGDVTYQVFRSTTSNIADARKVATTTAATYADSVSDFFGNYYYWVVATLDGMSATSECAAATRNPDLLPLRNLLSLIESAAGGIRDGILSDYELTRAMKHGNIADMDGNPKTVSAAELAIFKRIEVLNQDKALISAVIRGDYSGIPRATMEELQDLNNEEYELTKNRVH